MKRKTNKNNIKWEKEIKEEAKSASKEQKKKEERKKGASDFLYNNSKYNCKFIFWFMLSI